MRLTVLGSGSALPTRARASAGYLVEWSGGALLLELSAGTTARALAVGLDLAALDAVVLSHLHPDHTADLPGLLWARRQAKLASDFTIAGPPGTADLVARLLAAHGFEARYAVTGFPWRGAGLAVEAFPARHSPEAVCLRLEADGKVLGYSGDTADGEGVRAACRGADLALLECTSMAPETGHLTPADCAAVATAVRPRRVLLTHLGPGIESSLPQAADGLVVEL